MPLPEWVIEQMKATGRFPNRLFCDVELERPEVIWCIDHDPTLNDEQKEYFKRHGTLEGM